MVEESFKHLHEQFVHDDVVYRFDARPVLTVLKRVQTTAQRKVSAVLGFLPNIVGQHHLMHNHGVLVLFVAVGLVVLDGIGDTL